jgi:tRNA(adenine34) deaminase
MDLCHMTAVLELARQAAFADEVPVGALIVREGLFLGEGFNHNLGSCDPTAHAEIQALRAAAKFLGNHRLPGATLYVNLEPCPMCFAALMQARIKRLVFAAQDPKGGYRLFFPDECLPRFHHALEVEGGLLAEESQGLLLSFFQGKRARGKRKWLRSKVREEKE